MRFCRLHVSVIVIALMVVAASAVFMQVPASADNSDASDAIRLEETNWIWTPRAKESFSLLMRFRKSFTVDGELSRAQLVVTGDRTVTAYVNGERIGSSAEWSVLQVYDITEYLTEGENVVSAVVTANLTSGSSDGGLLAQIVLKDTAGRTTRISTDETWQVTDAIPRGNSWMIPASMGGGDAGVEWDFADLISSYDDSKWGVLALGGAYKHPEYSEFKGEYLQAHYADYYKDYLRINETTGLMERNGQVFRPFFAIYNQASTAGSELSILKWDFDQLEEDLKIMERNQIHPYIRFFSWSELLNPDGTWKVVSDQPKGSDLPRFRYNYEIYDYFLDRVQAHGLYVMAEIPLYWGINYDVIPEEYRGAYIVIDEYWDKMVEAYTRIIDYYSKRTVIAMFMIGEEGLVFDTGILTNPHKNATEIPETQSKFAAYLESKYGTVDAMKQAWGSGYDCSSKQSEWSVQYPYTAEAFDYISEFSDVKVPVFEQRTYNENVLRDPVVIDLMEFKQWLIVEQCNKWAESVRKVDPNHILFYCNAHDFTMSWHFLHAFDRARFAFDLVGVGQHDSGHEYPDTPYWARAREYIQNVASYGPYLKANGALPIGFCNGEGEGGVTPEGVALYYPNWMADLFGNGSAAALCYHWMHIKPVADQLGEVLRAVQDVPFTYNRDAKVLIMRNTANAFSNASGIDFAGASYFASILYQLHIPFDIVPDADLTYGTEEQFKIDINNYDFIFIPSQYQILPDRTWEILDKWISDPEHAGKRGLVMGMYLPQDSYFNDLEPDQLNPVFVKLMGTTGYSEYTRTRGFGFEYAAKLGDYDVGDAMEIDLYSREIGLFGPDLPDGVESIVKVSGRDKRSLVIRNKVNDNYVYSFGFYLGLASNPVWGSAKQQTPYNKLTGLYRTILEESGIVAEFEAPDNIGVYISDNKEMVIAKEMYGKKVSTVLRTDEPGLGVYSGAATILSPDGTVTIERDIEPYHTYYMKRVAEIIAHEGRLVVSHFEQDGEGWIVVEGDGELELSVDGASPIRVRVDGGEALRVPIRRS
ncbi:MAG: alpha-L-rhamnosidase N-terminal domain-containing protein [Bacillota bacterium]|jgi:hypothetical protein